MTAPSTYRWVSHPDDCRARLYNVGILTDGTLHNPNGYSEDLVRRAVLEADARHQARRKEATQKAVATRARRHELRVTQTAQAIVAGNQFGPSSTCIICRKTLSDEASIARGIGSECWQHLLGRIERLRAERVPPVQAA